MRDARTASGRVVKPAECQAIGLVSAAGNSVRSKATSVEMTPKPFRECTGSSSLAVPNPDPETPAQAPRGARQYAGVARRKLSFKDMHALETLPGKIAALEAEIARLQRVMSDPALFARDRFTFDRTLRALAGAQAELVAAEERWLELELLRSEVEGG
jgi:hypothetical protein